jgi:hypothetical protein
MNVPLILFNPEDSTVNRLCYKTESFKSKVVTTDAGWLSS